MLNVGGPELLIILLVALIFLGPQRLPEVARQLGQAVSSLKSLASGFQAEIEAASRPDTDSMRLDGPTSTSEAIAKTQNRPVAGTQDPFQAEGADGDGNGEATGPAAGGDAETEYTGPPRSLVEAARNMKHDGEVKPVSPGGPRDLRDGSHDADRVESGGGGAEADPDGAPETESGERE